MFEAMQLVAMAGLFSVALVVAWSLSRIPGIRPVGSARRNDQLDGLRGVAAIAVVGCHVTQYIMSYAGFTEKPEVGNHMGILGVQIFFSLTAYLFTDRALSGKLVVQEFAISRFRRIIPLYAIVVTVAILLGFFFTQHRSQPVGETAFELAKIASYGFWHHKTLTLNGLNMLSLVGIAWTLSYEWGFYALLVPAYFLWNFSRPVAMAVLFLVFGLAVYSFSQQSEQVIWPFFLPGVVGALLKRYAPKPSAWLVRTLPWVALICAALVIVLPTFWTMTKLLLVTGVFLPMLFASIPLLTIRPLLTLGTISYSVYLLQYIVLFPMVQLMGKLPGIFAGQIEMIAGSVFVVVLLIPLSVLSFLFIEKPFSRPLERGDPARTPRTAQRALAP